MKSFKIINSGCKVNYYEAIALKQALESQGFVEKPDPDIFIINTCTVTSKADSKNLYSIRKIKHDFPQAKVAVIGCMVEDNKDRLKSAGADFLFNQEDKFRVINILTSFDKQYTTWDMQVSNFIHNRALVKIQDGCNNRCSFCKVCLVRGKSISRPYQDILEEVESLVKKGFEEIIICGVNILDYKDLDSNLDFKGLLDKVSSLEGLGRVRLSSLEPINLDDDLIDYLSFNKKICPHFHIPFQSADSDILKAMNRKVDSSFYYRIVDRIKKNNPWAGISCDFIIGFPGEKDINFRNTVEFIGYIKPVKVHLFSFSARQGTKAWGMDDKISPKVIRERKEFLEGYSAKRCQEFLSNFIDSDLEVVFDAKSKMDFAFGYSKEYIRVKLPLSGFIPTPKITLVLAKEVQKGAILAQI